MGKKVTKIFGLSDLLGIFPELMPYANQEAVLATIFHVISMQVQLAKLNPDSIFQIGKTSQVGRNNEYLINLEGRMLCVVTRWTQINRNSFAGLSREDRARLPDRGMMPPPAMLTIKEMVISGCEEDLVASVHRMISTYVSVTFGNARWFEIVKQFARRRVCGQPYPCFALQSEVVAFYAIGLTD